MKRKYPLQQASPQRRIRLTQSICQKHRQAEGAGCHGAIHSRQGHRTSPPPGPAFCRAGKFRLESPPAPRTRNHVGKQECKAPTLGSQPTAVPASTGQPSLLDRPQDIARIRLDPPCQQATRHIKPALMSGTPPLKPPPPVNWRPPGPPAPPSRAELPGPENTCQETNQDQWTPPLINLRFQSV
jgi:hypothetical protein